MYIYIYVYIYMCIYMAPPSDVKLSGAEQVFLRFVIYIYIYIYI